MNPDIPLPTSEDPIWSRRLHNSGELKRAASEACIKHSLISRFDHIFVDCGSTFAYLAELIFAHAQDLAPITIYTTNVEVFQAYLRSPNRNLMDFRLIGGRFIPHHHSLDGSSFSFPESSRPYLFDKSFIGVCPLDNKLRIMASITDVISIKKEIIQRSAEVILVCDETKFCEPPPGSRPVGQLITGPGVLQISTDPGNRLVPARVIIGVSSGCSVSPHLKGFLRLSNSCNLLSQGVVKLEPSLGEAGSL